MKKKVYFNENGGEYIGWFIVTYNKNFYQVNRNTVEVDGIRVEVDEDIIEIKEL